MSFFLALDVSDDVRARVAAMMEAEKRDAPARWLRPEKLHLTLVFLGNADPLSDASFVTRVDSVCRAQPPLSLGLAGAGQFATARAAEVLWLGVTGALESLSALHTSLLQAIQLPADRPYVPHVTLARAQTGGTFATALERLKAFTAGPWLSDHLVLYESAHDRYTPRHHWRLSPV